MISNYFHDLSVALLASNLLVVFYLGRLFDKNGCSDDYMPSIFSKLAKVTYAALAFVLVGGAVRSYFFMDYEWNPAVGEGQVAALIVKHVLLVTITLVGVAGHLKYQKKYGK